MDDVARSGVGHALRPTRRTVLGTGAAIAAALFGIDWRHTVDAVAAGVLRAPGMIPDPSRPIGSPDPTIPIDHVVIVMMENHSFDCYLGMLPHVTGGRPSADGLAIDIDGTPLNYNPASATGFIRSFHMPSSCQMESNPSQAWDATHLSVNGGRMDGFVLAPQCGDVSMGYWDQTDIPFYYSLASTFPVANRWFAAAQAQTYPNRRFLYAATAYGLIATITPGPNDPGPPNGTIFDRLNAHGISWLDYATDLPEIAIIPSVVKSNPTHVAPIAQFYADAAAGNLPNVSLVNPDFDVVDAIGSLPPNSPVPPSTRANGEDEENPSNVNYGENFVSRVVNAILQSPHWTKQNVMLVWCYDEHGGYFDHVAPPAAVKPDDIPPLLGPGDVQDGYDVYGVRVPAVVVSPWSRSNYTSNVVHDHTSILSFIETKWNLPAMTMRDANADNLLDFFDFSSPAFATPPQLAAPKNPAVSDVACSTADPNRPIEPYPGGQRPANPIVLPSTAPTGVPEYPLATLAGAGAALGAFMRRRAQAGDREDPRTGA
jgi:phospholipase C